MIKKLLEIYKNKLRPRFKKIFIGLIIFFGVFTLVGFFGFASDLEIYFDKETF